MVSDPGAEPEVVGGGGGKQMTLYKVGGGHSHFLVLFVRPIILGV